MAAVMTPEQQQLMIAQAMGNTGGINRAAGRKGSMNFPGVRQSWMDDEKTQLANSLLQQGTSGAPVAGGGWGWAEGLARLGAGAMGGKWAGEQRRAYEDEANARANEFGQRYQQAMGGGQPASPAAGFTPGPNPNAAPLSGAVSNIAQSMTGMPPTANAGAPPPNPIQPPVVNRGQTLTPRGRGPVSPASPVGAGANNYTGNAFQDYRSAAYDPLEAAAEKKYGLPSGILRSIRVNGERSNMDQVSPTGARTVYQFTRGTRRLFNNKYGVDAWAGPRQSVEAAALHLKESLAKNGGDVIGAIKDYRGYNATHDDDYISRVARPLGINYAGGGSRSSSVSHGSSVTDRVSQPMYGPQDITVPDLPDAPVRPDAPEIAQSAPSKRRLLAEALMGGGDAMFPLMQSNLEAGMQEEADLNKQREENMAQLKSLGYQSDMQTYGSMLGNRYEQTLRDRQTANEARYGLMKGQTEHEQRMSENAQQGQIQKDVAGIKQYKAYDPNDPKVMRLIKPFSDARESATSMEANTNAILDLTSKMPSQGMLGLTGSAQKMYSANIAQLEMMRNQIVYDMAHGKLGAGFSEGDRKFLENMHPFTTTTPVPAMRRDAIILQRIAQRAQQYNQGAIDALGEGRYAQFESQWGKYTRDTPYMKGKLPLEKVPSFEEYSAAGQ